WRHQHHALFRIEAVHLDEQLLQGLLTLVMTATQSSAEVTTDGVDFLDDDDARSVRLALLEQITHSARADSDEHLDKIGSRHREEGPARFTSDGSGEKGFPRAGRADQQCTLRQPPAEFGELLRIFQELDDLLQLDLRLVSASDVVERDFGRVPREKLCLRLTEAEGLRSARLH